MTNIPTRDELYKLVDDDFHMYYPDAPQRLSKRDTEWIAKWNEVCHSKLNDETNRVYWAENPDAPQKLDDSPEWERYRKAWIEIRDQIMSNQPGPELNDDEVDLSYARAGVTRFYLNSEGQLLPDMKERVWPRLDAMLDEVERAVKNHEVPDNGNTWQVPKETITSELDSNQQVEFAVYVWFHDGYLDGSIVWNLQGALY